MIAHLPRGPRPADLDDTVASTTAVVAASGTSPLDRVPDSAALATAVAMADLIDTLLEVGPEVRTDVEERTGLRLGQLRVLHVVGDGVHRPRQVADRLGEHLDATLATIGSLQRDGLVVADVFDPADGEVRITEQGRARIDQLAALQMRLIAELPPSTGRRLLASIRVLVTRLAEVDRTTVVPLPPGPSAA